MFNLKRHIAHQNFINFVFFNTIKNAQDEFLYNNIGLLENLDQRHINENRPWFENSMLQNALETCSRILFTYFDRHRIKSSE